MKSTKHSNLATLRNFRLARVGSVTARFAGRSLIQAVIGSVLLMFVVTTPMSAASAADESSLFLSKVAPVLQRRCLSCHNSAERKGEFSLATASMARKGGESGAVIVPGKPDESYLLDLITPEGGNAEMPKDADPLAADEIAAIRKWIAAGAKWPAEFAVTDRLATHLRQLRFPNWKVARTRAENSRML